MSQKPAVAAAPPVAAGLRSEVPAPRLSAPPRPSVVDYFFLLVGVALSFYLVRIDPRPVQPADWVQDERARAFVACLPDLMRLPQGVILMWPVFLLLQRIRFRKKSLTSIEWLWVLSWLGLALLAGLAVWNAPQGIPDGVRPPDFIKPFIQAAPVWWYFIFVPTLAAFALLLWFFGLFARDPAPWTHSFGLALLVWPVLPLAGMWAMCKFGS